jgi:fatty-acid desaturase
VWWFPFALGEQYHNYHHAFPRDYRHGIRRWDFDPTKWLITGLARVGLATDLFAMPARRIEQALAEASAVASDTLKMATPQRAKENV